MKIEAKQRLLAATPSSPHLDRIAAEMWKQGHGQRKESFDQSYSDARDRSRSRLSEYDQDLSKCDPAEVAEITLGTYSQLRDWAESKGLSHRVVDLLCDVRESVTRGGGKGHS